ncbi:MAG: zf-HC2 domain-containing protein, partial [Candidatus Korobacteraceae bacterium]
MNQRIPKPLRDALARQVAGEVHPSPDQLTAFMERTLTPVESEVVVHHLAQCAECREIVFLASEAAEDELMDERELVAVAPTGVAVKPAYVAASVPAAAQAEK